MFRFGRRFAFFGLSFSLVCSLLVGVMLTGVLVSKSQAQAGSYASVVQASSPLVYWRLDETTGAVAADSSGAALPGSYAAGATLGQQSLPGIGTAVSGQVSRPSLPVGTGAVSLEFWSRGDGTLGGRGFLARVGDLGIERSVDGVGAYNHETLRLRSSNGAYTYGEYPVDPYCDCPVRPLNYASTLWRHFVLTFEGTVATLFVDGSEYLRLDAAWDRTNTSVVVGEAAGRAYDEFAVYNKALTPKEVSDRFTLGHGLAACSSGTANPFKAEAVADGAVGLWQFDSGPRVAVDSIGCRNGGFREPIAAVDSPSGMMANLRGLSSSMTTWSGVTLEFWAKAQGGLGGRGFMARLGGLGLERGVDGVGAYYHDTLRLTTGPGSYSIPEYPVDPYCNCAIRPIDYESPTWHHYVVTHDGTKAVLYIDGEERFSREAAWDRTDQFLNVGSAGGRFYDDVAVYPSVLSRTKISRHFAIGLTGRECVAGSGGDTSHFVVTNGTQLVDDVKGCRNVAFRQVPQQTQGQFAQDGFTKPMGGHVGAMIPATGGFTVSFWSKGDRRFRRSWLGCSGWRHGLVSGSEPLGLLLPRVDVLACSARPGIAE
jgi:hypothetical protein